jgi:hypothetical protein
MGKTTSEWHFGSVRLGAFGPSLRASSEIRLRLFRSVATTKKLARLYDKSVSPILNLPNIVHYLIMLNSNICNTRKRN